MNNRHLIGRILFVSAALMAALALAFYTGLIPIEDGGFRTNIAVILGAVALLDAVLAGYFMTSRH